jgi:hypothetical protein
MRRQWPLATGCWLLAAGCWLLAAGCWLLAAVDRFFGIGISYSLGGIAISANHNPLGCQPPANTSNRLPAPLRAPWQPSTIGQTHRLPFASKDLRNPAA